MVGHMTLDISKRFADSCRWYGRVKVQGNQISSIPTKNTDLRRITEEDDDDELNIPVL